MVTWPVSKQGKESDPGLPRSSEETRTAVKIEGPIPNPHGLFISLGGCRIWAESCLLAQGAHTESSKTYSCQRLPHPSGPGSACDLLLFKERQSQMHFKVDISVCFLLNKSTLKVPTHSTPSFQGPLIQSLRPNHKHGKLHNRQGQQSQRYIKGEFQQNAVQFLNSYQMSSRRLKLLQ